VYAVHAIMSTLPKNNHFMKYILRQNQDAYDDCTVLYPCQTLLIRTSLILNLTNPNTTFNDSHIDFRVLFIEYKASPIRNVHFSNLNISLI